MPSIDRPGRGDGPVVTGFSGTLINVDGNPRPGGVVLTPLTALDWDEENLHAALDLDPPPEFVLFGTGAELVQPDRSLLAELARRNIGVEAMDTRAAARAWSLLRLEGRWISAALRAL